MSTSRTLDTNVYRMFISWNKDTAGKIVGLETLDNMLKDFTYDTLNEFYKETILLWLNEETKAFNNHMSQLDADSETYFSNNKAFKTAKDILFNLQDAIRNTIIKDQKVLVNKIKEALIAIINFKRQYNQSKEALASAWHQENIRLNKKLTEAEDTYHNQKIELIEVFKKTRDDHDKTEKSPYGRILEISVSIPHSKLSRYKTGTSLKQARDFITKYEQALKSDRNNKIPAKGFLEIIISALGLEHYFPATEKPSKPIPTASHSSLSDNQEHEALALPKKTLTRLEPTKIPLEKTETENTDTHKAPAAKPMRSAISRRTVKPAKRLDRTLFTDSPQPEPAPVFEPKVDTGFSLSSSLSVALESANTFLQYCLKLLNPDTPTTEEVVTASEQNKIRPTNDEVLTASEHKKPHRAKPTNQSYFQWSKEPNKATIPSQTTATQSAASETENSYILSLKTELQALKKLCDDHNIKQPNMIERIERVLNAKDAIFLGRDKKTIEEHVILYQDQESLEKKLSLKFLSHTKTVANQSCMRSLRTTGSIYLAEHLKDIYEQIAKSCKNHQYNLDAEQDLRLHAEKYGREELTGLTQMRKLTR